MYHRLLSELLGLGAGDRALIVNADDFGLCEAGNRATIEGLASGAYSSATLMAPCPRFAEAAAFARTRPDLDFGVHLTLTSEWAACRWAPVCGPHRVPSLVDESGNFFATVPAVFENARPEEVERESRAQIETVLSSGVDVTHLDAHMGALHLDRRYHDVYVRLAAEYRLPIRMLGRTRMIESGMEDFLAEADRLGVLAPDHLHYGGPPSLGETESYWTRVLRQLPPGVTEIYVHPADPDAELQAMPERRAQGAADHAFFTGATARAVLDECRVTRVGYRSIRDLQRRGAAC